MKKTLILAIAAIALAACSTPAKLINTSTHKNSAVKFQTTAVVADIQVSDKKASHLFVPSKTVIAGGYDNIIDSAVRETIQSAGDFDVLVALETQVKYDKDGQVESVLVTGYPGKYVNWRHSDELVTPEPKAEGGLFGLSFGKKK